SSTRCCTRSGASRRSERARMTVGFRRHLLNKTRAGTISSLWAPSDDDAAPEMACCCQSSGIAMLEVAGLKKGFGNVVAVDGVLFTVSPGESVGLLGPNGAGKTTTVSMICGLLRPDEGQVLLHGRPIRDDTDPAKRQIGLVTQELALFEE